LVGSVGLAAFAISLWLEPGDFAHARGLTASVVVFTELARALAARSRTLAWWQLGLRSNPYLLYALLISALLQFAVVALPFTQSILEMPNHGLVHWSVVLVLALIPMLTIEAIKLISGKFRSDEATLK
jgi:Ca2+-transporting ATPase